MRIPALPKNEKESATPKPTRWEVIRNAIMNIFPKKRRYIKVPPKK